MGSAQCGHVRVFVEIDKAVTPSKIACKVYTLEGAGRCSILLTLRVLIKEPASDQGCLSDLTGAPWTLRLADLQYAGQRAGTTSNTCVPNPSWNWGRFFCRMAW
jgi:hypothetical protein